MRSAVHHSTSHQDFVGFRNAVLFALALLAVGIVAGRFLE